MRKSLIMTVGFACCTGVTFAALPFVDSFGSAGPVAGWVDEAPFGGGTLTTVQTDTDWRSVTINPPAGNTDGYFAKLEATTTAAGTRWFLAGEDSDTNYTVEAKVYGPIVNADSPPDNFLYQMILFYQNSGGYGRVHLQFNENATPRIRMQTSTGGFNTPVELTSPTDFAATEGWYTLRIELDGSDYKLTVTPPTGSEVVVEGELAAAHATNGKFGIGQYQNGAGTRAAYFDAFSATETTSLRDWSAYE